MNLYLIAIIALILSFITDRKKTKKALIIFTKKIKKIFLPFLTIIILISISLFYINPETISKIIDNDSSILSLIVIIAVGSIANIPGFIAFPLSSVLIDNGAPYYYIAAFTTSLMLIGITTFSFEATFIGKRNALYRNIISLFICLIVTFIVGIFYGEIL